MNGMFAIAVAEQAIFVGLVTLAVSMLVAVVLLLMGVRRGLEATAVRAA
jgi:hypothetical protein